MENFLNTNEYFHVHVLFTFIAYLFTSLIHLYLTLLPNGDPKATYIILIFSQPPCEAG